jgi:hypothetical protein
MSLAQRVFLGIGSASLLGALICFARMQENAAVNNFLLILLVPFGVTCALWSLAKRGLVFAGLFVMMFSVIPYLKGSWLFGYYSEAGQIAGVLIAFALGFIGSILLLVGLVIRPKQLES